MANLAHRQDDLRSVFELRTAGGLEMIANVTTGSDAGPSGLMPIPEEPLDCRAYISPSLDRKSAVTLVSPIS